MALAASIIVVSALLLQRCCGTAPRLLEAVQRLPSVLSSPHLYVGKDDGCIAVISEDIVFKSDVVTARGVAEYRKIHESFGNAKEELCDLQFNVISFYVGPSTISVSWNASFVPYAVQGVYYFCKLLGKEVCFFDILAREREASTFSWAKLGAFVSSLLLSDRVRLLRAVVLGTTEYYYDLVDRDTSSSSSGGGDNKRLVIKSAVERIGLIKRLDDGAVKNRAIVSHLVEFLDSRRVANMDAGAWSAEVTDRLRPGAVPGSGQFDIDGLSDERRQELLETSNQALFFANLLVLGVGVVLSFSLLYKLYFGIDSNSYYKGYSGRNVPKDFFSGGQRDGKINRAYLDEDDF